MPDSSVRELSRQWVDRLAPYRQHRNDEHLEALVEETLSYAGSQLAGELSQSEYWSKAPLARCVAALLFLVDRGIVNRVAHQGVRVFEPTEGAEAWASETEALAPYRAPTLELIASLRREQARRSRPTRP
ncbi:MAG: hypothetical protein JO329_20980 [Planctomycetaceae bacterium]|nr:hypothetical protein [Planctomycetaceae bacterium]